jgi:hypothetical protein
LLFPLLLFTGVVTAIGLALAETCVLITASGADWRSASFVAAVCWLLIEFMVVRVF